MNEQMPQGHRLRRVEIGLDGKPFEVWEPAPQPSQGAPPPAQGGWNPSPSASYGEGAGSFYPRGPAERAALLTPRNSMEHNDYAWFSIGLAVAAVIGLAVYWGTGSGGALPYATFAMGAAGFYYGIRAHNAGLRGFCTNGRMGLVGMVLSALAALGTIVLAFAMLAAATADISAG